MKVTLTYRQALALYRVAQSMNLVHARISTTREDLLTEAEMQDLQRRLGRHLDDWDWEESDEEPVEVPSLRSRLRVKGGRRE